MSVDGITYVCGYAELGNPGIPRAVVEIQGLRTYDEEKLRLLGRKLRNHPAFPKGANVNFYELIGENELVEKTYERGVEDFTLACGTGSGSVAAILTKKGLVDGKAYQNSCAGRHTLDPLRCVVKTTQCPRSFDRNDKSGGRGRSYRRRFLFGGLIYYGENNHDGLYQSERAVADRL